MDVPLHTEGISILYFRGHKPYFLNHDVSKWSSLLIGHRLHLIFAKV